MFEYYIYSIYTLYKNFFQSLEHPERTEERQEVAFNTLTSVVKTHKQHWTCLEKIDAILP